MDTPSDAEYDATNNRLFVSEDYNRVLVYDVASITDGEAAVHVLGQADFTSGASATTPTGMGIPRGLAYDSVGQRLFVDQFSNNRITVYDVASITDGEAATHVIGQPNMTSDSTATTQSGLNVPIGIEYDTTTNTLYVAEYVNNRVLSYAAANVTAAVSNVSASTANGTYKEGDTVNIQLTSNVNLFVTGTPRILLETGSTDQYATYASGTGTNTLVFTYTVQAGDTATDLDYVATTSLGLNSGTITDFAGASLVLTLPSPGATNSLGANKNIVIDTTSPAVTVSFSPSQQIYLTGGSLTISGACENGLAITISSSLFSTVTPSCSSGTYSTLVNVTNVGIGTVSVSQTDAVGNIGTVTSSSIEFANPGVVLLGGGFNSGGFTSNSVVNTNQTTTPVNNVTNNTNSIPPENSCPVLIKQKLIFGHKDKKGGISEVAVLQKFLNKYNFSAGVADGIFGVKTQKSVKAFQKTKNIQVDGIVGPQTRAIINAYCENPLEYNK